MTLQVKQKGSMQNLRPYVPGRPIDDVKKLYGLSDVVKLASNENPLGTSEAAKAAYVAAAADMSLYPDGSCTVLREKLAEFLGVPQDTIVFGTGTDEVISTIALGVMEQGDEMITGKITFPQYDSAVAALYGVTVFTDMKDDGLDLDKMLAAITDKTKLICISNPNNPTGTLITDKEKIAFLDKVPKNVLVVFDEAYGEYVETSEYTSSIRLLKTYSNLVVLNTFSKAYGLAGLRVGYGVMHPELAGLLERVRKPFNVTVPAQAAAVAALGAQDFIELTRKENIASKRYCYEMFDKMGLPYVKTEGNFIMVDVKTDSGVVFEKLMKKGYIIRPGKAFGMDTHLRVSLGTVAEMKGFVETLDEILK